MASDRGKVRTDNEDAVIFVAPGEGGPGRDRGFLALIADGMGGHAAGEIASGLAAEIVRRAVYSTDGPARDGLAQAFELANRGILNYSLAHPETKGMGTTCTAIFIDGDQLWFAHIGDSRAYLLREGVFEQLTSDQTLHAQLIRDGIMSAAEAAASPGGNFILQALGAREDIEPEISRDGLRLQPDDILVLCSDGLHGFVADGEIAEIAALAAPGEACQALIAKANAAGGADNISVGVFRVLSEAPPVTRQQAATTKIDIYEPGPEEPDDFSAPV